MGIKIDMSNVKIGGSAQVLNNASIRGNGDADISLSGAEITGNTVILDNLKIEPFMEELQNALSKTDANSPEYGSLKQIAEAKGKNKETIVEMIKKHIGTFSEGVLEKVLAAYISRGW